MKNTILDADKDTVVAKIAEAILRAWGETNSAIHSTAPLSVTLSAPIS